MLHVYTYLHLFLSRGKSTFQNPSQPLESLGFLTFFKFAKVRWRECVRFGSHAYASWKDDPMSGRRKFGSILVRSARDGHKYVQARYQPPAWAYSKWPDLPRHYTKNFDADYTAMAEAWLAEQERLIKLGSWEPPRIEKTKELSSTITFREYALDFVQNRRKPNGQRIAPTTREKYLQYLDDYLLPVLGDKSMGSIGPRDVERWADSMRVGKAGEGLPSSTRRMCCCARSSETRASGNWTKTARRCSLRTPSTSKSASPPSASNSWISAQAS